jgi:hypothetical protein
MMMYTPLRIAAANELVKLYAVHARHHPIQNNYLRSALCLQAVPSVVAITGNDDIKSPAREHALEDVSKDRAVICHEKFHKPNIKRGSR